MKHYKNITHFLLVSLCLVGSSVYAGDVPKGELPTGGKVAAGQADISQHDSRMTVNQSTQKAIINWQTFNVGSDASVNYQQPSQSSVTLNRVLSNDPSSIMGSITANGSVFFTNPNGVLFGPGARVDVGGLVSSTLSIGDDDFLQGNYRFFRDGAEGRVVNEGELLGQYVALLAPEVQNHGVIVARQGTVALASGDDVTLNITGNHLIDVQVNKASIDTLVENRHLIQADEGTVILSAQSANGLVGDVINSGTIEAKGISNEGGVIRLLASSSVNHSGEINADAGTTGDGGNVLLVADLANSESETTVSGTISARGGDTSGNGGFIETSASHIEIEDSAIIDTNSIFGNVGQWLIDPVNFTIGVNGDITASTLETNLGTSNVTIQSANGAQGTDGDIFVNDSLSWSTNELTLDAYRNIWINAPMSITSGGGLNLYFGQGGTIANFPEGGYFVKSHIDLASDSSFSTKYGSDGSVVDYTVITDEAGLLGINSGLSGNYVLGSDITASTTPWAPIGNASGDILTATAFTGTLDGLGHTIDGLTRANTANSTAVGLFGILGDGFTGGTVQNLGLTNVNLAGLSAVGALAGINNGTVYNVYSTGSVTGSDIAGVGFAPGTNDDFVADIGGLVGRNIGSLSFSYSEVNVTATSGAQTSGMGFDGGIGGLAGVNDGTIDSSYATGSVSGIYDVGGLVGYTLGAISASHSRGAVSGTTNVGGLIGAMGDPFIGALPGILTDTYWDTTTSGQATSAGDALNSSTGLTTTDALQQSSYSGLDFTNTWIMYDGISYPMLRSALTPFVVVADDASKTYDQTTYSSFTSSTSGSMPGAITGTVTYSGTATTAIDAGTYTITPGGLSISTAGKQDQQGYYIVYEDGTLTIDKAALTVTADAGQGKVYGNIDSGLTYSITAGSLFGSDSLTGSLDRAAGEDVGNYAINVGTLTAGGNYDLTFGADDYAITPRPITVTADSGQGKVYGNADSGYTYSVTTGSLVSGDSLTGSLDRAAGEDVGNYAINVGTLTAGGNYDLTFGADDYEITPRSITVTADAGQGKVYGNADSGYTYSVTTGSLVSGDSLTGSLDRAAGEDVGNYAINVGTLTAGGNYDLTFGTDDYEITPRPITVTADSGQGKVYGNADSGYTYSVTTGSLVSGDSLTGSLDRAAGEDVGNYAINVGTLTAGGNYDLTFGADGYEITPRPITVTADSGQGKVYGNADSGYTYSVTTGSLVSGDSLTGSLDRAAGEDVGNYAINVGTLTAGGNYDLTFGADDYEITARSVTVTADTGQNKVHGTADPSLSYTVTTGSLVGDDLFTGSLTRDAGETVGFYDITQGTLDLGTNYDLTYESNQFEIIEKTVSKSTTPDSGKVTTDIKKGLTNNKKNTPGTSKDLIKIDSDEFMGKKKNTNDNETAQEALREATKDSEKKRKEAIAANVKAKLLADAAKADPNSEEKAQAAKQAAQKAAQLKTAADKASEKLVQAEKKAIKAKAEAQANERLPKDRSTFISTIKKAAKAKVEAFAFAFSCLGVQVNKMSESEKKEFNAKSKRITEAYQKAEEDLKDVPKDTLDKVIKFASAEYEREELEKKKEAAEKALEDAKKTEKEALLAAKKSELFAKKAAEAAANDPDSPEKAAAARRASLKALTDTMQLRKAKTAVTDAESDAAETFAEYRSAKLKEDVIYAETVSHLSDKDDAKAQDTAKEKGTDMLKAKFNSALAGAFTGLSNNFLNGMPDQLKKEEDQHKEEIAKKGELADSAKEAAQKKQSTADAKKAAVTKAKEDIIADKDNPKKAGIRAQIALLNKEVVRLQSQLGTHYASTKQHFGAYNAATKAQEKMVNIYFARGRSLQKLQADLETAKTLLRDASNAVANTGGLPAESYENVKTARMALDPNKLKVVNADAVRDYANDPSSIRYTERLRRQADDAQTAADKAVEDAKAAKAEADRLAAEAKDAADPAKARARAQKAAKRLAEAQAQVEALSALAKDQERKAAQAEADHAEAKKQAEETAADSAAARVAVKKAEAKKAAEDKILHEKAVAAHKAALARRAAYAKEMDEAAKSAKKAVEKAKADKIKWEKTVEAKTAEIPQKEALYKKNAAAAKQAKDQFDKDNAAVLAANNEVRAADAKAAALKPGVTKANADLQKAADEKDAAKAALDKLAFGLKGSNALGVALSVADEIRKANKKDAAKARVAKANAEYNRLLKIAKAKVDARNAFVQQAQTAEAKARAAAKKAQKSATAANDAAIIEARSKQAFEQAKLDKTTAEKNVEIFTKHISDTTQYASAVGEEAAKYSQYLE